ncbi:hypothetical protein GOP47_0008760 [Adiantum capillus-veneris]|uniref:Uncharacterized protein n=1 Tax=Adiantum capillus-veneris TaxID=13818 RepID=A0A9D4UYY1_ADICA|nr:hypothetical protein GOP47_0008760 [Adiantum capillus-veneris]
MASRALEASVELLCGSDLHSSSTSTSNSQSLLSLSPTFHFLKRAIVFSSTQHQSSWTTALPLVCRSSYGGAPNAFAGFPLLLICCWESMGEVTPRDELEGAMAIAWHSSPAIKLCLPTVCDKVQGRRSFLFDACKQAHVPQILFVPLATMRYHATCVDRQAVGVLQWYRAGDALMRLMSQHAFSLPKLLARGSAGEACCAEFSMGKSSEGAIKLTTHGGAQRSTKVAATLATLVVFTSKSGKWCICLRYKRLLRFL